MKDAKKPLSMKQFAALVRQAVESLPDEIMAALDNVVIEVAKAPTLEQLQSVDISEADHREGESLFGLFAPIDNLFGVEDFEADTLPEKLWIFRDPHLDEFTDPQQLQIEIRKTVIHEIAHHFGWSDRDLERFDEHPNPFSTGPKPTSTSK